MSNTFSSIGNAFKRAITPPGTGALEALAEQAQKTAATPPPAPTAPDIIVNAPQPQAPAPAPDPFSAAVQQAARASSQKALGAYGRSATLLSRRQASGRGTIGGGGGAPMGATMNFTKPSLGG